MKRPTLDREKVLWTSGKLLLAGIDEVGRGAWAGPVVAAAVVLPKHHRRISGVHDSKLVSAKMREQLYEKITERALDFGVGIVSHEVIDQIGILNATKLAAKEAVEMLESQPEHLLCDALDLREQLRIDQEAIIRGDQKVYSISCASIIAKVTRDRLMSALRGEYAIYEFEKHKGYGTKLHQALIAKNGVSNIHRRSYRPIKVFLGDE